jgi:hypothetical protein
MHTPSSATLLCMRIHTCLVNSFPSHALTTQHTPRRTAFSKCTPAALARVVTTRARALTWVRGHTRCTPGCLHAQCTWTS